jgi:hypothetical protein
MQGRLDPNPEKISQDPAESRFTALFFRKELAYFDEI